MAVIAVQDVACRIVPVGRAGVCGAGVSAAGPPNFNCAQTEGGTFAFLRRKKSKINGHPRNRCSRPDALVQRLSILTTLILCLSLCPVTTYFLKKLSFPFHTSFIRPFYYIHCSVATRHLVNALNYSKPDSPSLRTPEQANSLHIKTARLGKQAFPFTLLAYIHTTLGSKILHLPPFLGTRAPSFRSQQHEALSHRFRPHHLGTSLELWCRST